MLKKTTKKAVAGCISKLFESGESEAKQECCETENQNSEDGELMKLHRAETNCRVRR